MATPDQKEAQARLFLVRTLILVCCAALPIPAINAFVDPLNLFRRTEAPTRYGCDPGFRVLDRNALVLAVRDARPQVLMTGSSRVMIGHEADDPVVSATGSGAFNLGLPAAAFTDITRTIEDATADYSPGLLIVNLGLGAFTSSADAGSGSTASLRLRTWLSNLFSAAATTASIGALVYRGRCREAPRRPNGDAPSFVKGEVERRGREQLARTIDAEFVKTYATSAREMRRRHRDSALHEVPLAALSRLLARECARDTRLLLFFEPTHARLLEVVWTTGLWDDYERLKRVATERVEQSRRSGCKVEIWDFSGYNRYTTESFDDPAIRYFWESSHYTTTVGRAITRRLLGAADVDAEFGSRLTPGTIDAHLAALRAHRDRYARENPAVAAYVKGIVEAARAK